MKTEREFILAEYQTLALIYETSELPEHQNRVIEALEKLLEYDQEPQRIAA